MNATWLGYVLCSAAACGGKVLVDLGDGSGGGPSYGDFAASSGSTEGNPNDVLYDCNRFCEKYDKELGCGDFTCVDGCTTEYEDAGPCRADFTALLGCIVDNVTSCELPAVCKDEYDALQTCYASSPR